MDEQKKTIIRISRSKNIEASANNALLALDNFQNIVGQFVMVRYYKNPNHTEIDTLVTIGIQNGTGRESYKIVYIGDVKTLVNEIWTTPGTAPDVSLLAHGELYIIRNENNVWCYCYAVNDRRYIEPITGGPYVYLNVGDGYVYYFEDGVLRREGDFYTKAEVEALVDQKISELKTVDLNSLIGPGNVDIKFASHELVRETYLSGDDHELTPTSEKLFEGKAIYAFFEDKLRVIYPFTVSGTSISQTIISRKATSFTENLVATKKYISGETKDVTDETTFYYSVNNGTYVQTVSDPTITIPANTYENTTVTYRFKGIHPIWGEEIAPQTAVIRYGYKFLYGVVDKSWVNNVNLNSLSETSVTMKVSPYTTPGYTTTTLDQRPVLCIPKNWVSNPAAVTIKDQNQLDITAGWTRLDRTYNKTLDSSVQVSFYVFVKTVGALARDFKYIFTY